MEITPSGRKDYRKNVLKEFYNYYFNNDGKSCEVISNIKKDKEQYFAIKYLINKQYITVLHHMISTA